PPRPGGRILVYNTGNEGGFHDSLNVGLRAGHIAAGEWERLPEFSGHGVRHTNYSYVLDNSLRFFRQWNGIPDPEAVTDTAAAEGDGKDPNPTGPRPLPGPRP